MSSLETIVNEYENEVVKEKSFPRKEVFYLGLNIFVVQTIFILVSLIAIYRYEDEEIDFLVQILLYLIVILSSAFVPPLTIALGGHVACLGYCLGGCISWTFLHVFSETSTAAVIVATIELGLVLPILWTAQFSHLTVLARRLAYVAGKTEEVGISGVFGSFLSFYHLGWLSGSLILTTVLDTGDTNWPPVNETFTCGASYCDWEIYKRNDPSDTAIWSVFIASLMVGSAGIVPLVLLYLQGKSTRNNKSKEVKCRLIVSTFEHLKHTSQLLVIPITMYSGFIQYFYIVTFPHSYITCSSGTLVLGWVSIPFGVTSVFAASLSGYLVQKLGRLILFISGFFIDLVIQITLAFWEPTEDTAYVMYLMSSLMGLSIGHWLTQIHALYGVTFREDPEAAFSNYKLWETVGLLIIVICSRYLCINVQLYVLVTLLILGMAGYAGVEYKVNLKFNFKKRFHWLKNFSNKPDTQSIEQLSTTTM